MSGGTVLWYNTGEEEVTMKFTLPRTVKCFDVAHKIHIAELGIEIDATDAAKFFDGL